MELEDSKKIIKGEFGMNCPWYVGFEYKRDFEKNPLSWEENEMTSLRFGTVRRSSH